MLAKATKEILGWAIIALLFLIPGQYFVGMSDASAHRLIPDFVADITGHLPFTSEYKEQRLNHFFYTKKYDRANRYFFLHGKEFISNNTFIVSGDMPVRWFNQTNFYFLERHSTGFDFLDPNRHFIGTAIKHNNQDYLSYLMDRTFAQGDRESKGKLLLDFGIAVRNEKGCRNDILKHIGYLNDLMDAEPDNYVRYSHKDKGVNKIGADFIREACVNTGQYNDDRSAFKYRYDPYARFQADNRRTRKAEELRRIEQNRLRRKNGDDQFSKFRAALGSA